MAKSPAKTADKRERIVRTSLQLFARHGYESTTIRMIAEESGISMGLLYNYFSGKPEVLKTIFELSVIDIKNSFIINEVCESPLSKFTLLLDQIFHAVHRNLLFYKLFYSLRLQPPVQKLLQKELNALHAYVLAKLESMLVELGEENYQQKALLLNALLDGASNHYAMHSRSYPLEEIKSGIVNCFRN
jgi:AcrR family transcriptional regulator